VLGAALVAAPLVAFTSGDGARRAAREPARELARERTTWDSVYSVAQATRGQEVYAATCQACHLASLSGADQVPALAGGTFIGKWDGLTLGALHDRVRRTMPPSAPGSYARQDITDVIAYLLRENEYPAGLRALASDAESLAAIRITAVRAARSATP